MIVQGVERTIEQDPAFAVRIMVDVAIKALSPAINDPTTAVQVLNHLGDLLHVIGSADFRPSRAAAPRPGGCSFAARGWEEYLALGVTEIRAYGASSVQVVRRLRAMLEELHGAVRPEHRAAVEDELARLEAERGSGVRAVARPGPRGGARPAGARGRTGSRRPGGSQRALAGLLIPGQDSESGCVYLPNGMRRRVRGPSGTVEHDLS